jgi:uncharacterized protein (TIRG00374 family)
MQSEIWKFARKYWLLCSFLILIIFMSFFKISLKDIWRVISSLQLWQLLVLILFYFLVSGFNILSRKYLLHSLSAKTNYKDLALIHFSTMAAHYSTPVKLGFPFAVYLLNRFDNVPYSTGTAMIIVELIVSTGVCGIIAIFGSLIYFSRNTTSILFLSFTLLIFIFLSFYILVIFFRHKIQKGRLLRFFHDAYTALSSIALSKSVLYILFRTFIQIFSATNLVLLCAFFSSYIDFWQAVVASATAFFVGSLSMVPMGLGVREASMIFYLRHLGIPDDAVLSIVTIQRLLSTGLSFFLGSLFGTMLGVKNFKMDYEK